MKVQIVILALLLTGCRSYVHYYAYEGRQKDWPTGDGAFVTEIEGVKVYTTGFPPRPYEVLGIAVATRHHDHNLAAMARAHKADAIIITRVQNSNGGSVHYNTSTRSTYHIGNSEQTYGDSFGANIPITRTTIAAQLIKFYDFTPPPVPK